MTLDAPKAAVGFDSSIPLQLESLVNPRCLLLPLRHISVREIIERNANQMTLICVAPVRRRAADPEVVGSVSGFAPDIVLLLLAGLFASRVVNRRQSAS